MAAGRNGVLSDEEIKDLECTRKEIGYLNGNYSQTSNGNWENERGRIRDNLDYRVRVGQKDVKERVVKNGVYRPSSSRSDSGSSSGGHSRTRRESQTVDREPGELSSDGSDEGIDSETADLKETKFMLENGNHASPVQHKKRKFSPIVWDKDDRKARASVEVKKLSETSNLPPRPPPPPIVDRRNQSPSPKVAPIANVHELISNDIEVRTSEVACSEIDLQPELPADLSPVLHEEESHVDNHVGGAGTVDDQDDYMPTRTVISSRWANDADSPADEGEISDYDDARKTKRKSASVSHEVRGRKSNSPELGDVKKGPPEGARGRLSGSDGRVRSSSRDSYDENDEGNEYMEIDDSRNNDGYSSGRSDSESDDDRGSHSTQEPVCPPQRSVNMLKGCRSVDEFERLNKIDEGTYGVVYRAKDKKTGEVVALKKVKMEKEREGFPLTALREINVLLSFHHPSIVDVKEVVVGNSLDSIFMVMEYMEHDLKGLMESIKQPFSQSEVKCLMLQLLRGSKYLHDNWVLHRDLKTSNLLMNNRGELKICDFGLARQYGKPLKPYTHLVVTLWYRAPELLLGAKLYSTAIDMWSLGCIMAELLSKEPLFNGKSEIDQLDKIFRVLGTPNDTIWPGCTKLPGYKVNFVKHQYNLLRRKFPATSFTGSPVLSDAGFDLLNRLLTYDPEKRITAEEALNHEWFREVPLPKSKEFMPTFPAQHAQDRRVRRVMKSPDPLEEQRRKELQQGEIGSGGLFGQ